MPPGRKKVITEIVTEKKRTDAYEEIRKELKEGRQLYVICPKIESEDEGEEIKLDVKSVTSEAKRLKKERQLKIQSNLKIQCLKFVLLIPPNEQDTNQFM
jgi:ATP-dependent DNA helicase RecG